MSYSFDFTSLAGYAGMLWRGLWVTAGLTAVSALLGGLLGTLGAVGLRHGAAWLRAALLVYVEFMRNTPFLVQLFFIYFGLPSLGVQMPGWTAALLTMTLNLAAYQMEIVRAGFLAVGAGQYQAALSLGLQPMQAVRHVVLPQALAAVGPALFGQILMMLMGSAVVSQIAVPDLAEAASFIQSRTFRPFEVYLIVTGLYLALSLAARWLFNRVFARLAPGARGLGARP
ncbi:amino acid ABC transporter permease [Ottowia testudinis]|uniref:Amino acid ABC transporter permease n=1 Tax=Ottowia testudinis TaxID=2816950 RepID=A0A975H580_9BURK|nr:amino acid ABC transporter permease [Ottowia testudinis]QTD47101.1 amino acid ABC transporter permease [Ottowia testudinis]